MSPTARYVFQENSLRASFFEYDIIEKGISNPILEGVEVPPTTVRLIRCFSAIRSIHVLSLLDNSDRSLSLNGITVLLTERTRNFGKIPQHEVEPTLKRLLKAGIVERDEVGYALTNFG